MKKIIYFISGVLLFIVIFSLLVDTRERAAFKMGTFIRIKLSGFKWQDFNSAFSRAFSAIDDVSGMADMYDEKSLISRLNREAFKKPVAVNDELFFLIRDSKVISEQSNGAFDITVAPLVELWRPFKNRDSIPDKESIKSALALVGSEKIVLNERNKTVFFKKKNMKIDLSAIAKGYAVDKAIEAVRDSGFKSGIINAGGDLFCLGKKDFLFFWRVGIQDPDEKEDIVDILRISDKAVATSGGYEQYFAYKGTDYTHLIHPNTGYPVESIHTSVTVTADRCFLADAIATAVSVGGEDAKESLESSYPDIDIIQLQK